MTNFPVRKLFLSLALTFLVAISSLALAADDTPPGVQLQQDDAQGRLAVLIDGQEAIVYQYSSDQDLAHYYPVRSPSGKSMTVQHPDPFPHHRSFWFGDTLQLDGGRKVSTYSALYSGADRANPKPPFADHVRHVEFPPVEGTDAEPVVRAKLIWEMDGDTPLADEVRTMRVVPLGQGQYFLDFTFTVTANYGDLNFVSDWVHYAWPYIRMNTAFSVDGGGRIVNSEGGVNQAETNGKPADWVDYTNTIDGLTEGLAIFSHDDNEKPHGWLTRDYGCFGPRRIDAKSGKPFTLAKGQSISQRVGVLVHRGDVIAGQVAERYEAYIAGEL